jgi:hypothetical protein
MRVRHIVVCGLSGSNNFFPNYLLTHNSNAPQLTILRLVRGHSHERVQSRHSAGYCYFLMFIIPEQWIKLLTAICLLRKLKPLQVYEILRLHRAVISWKRQVSLNATFQPEWSSGSIQNLCFFSYWFNFLCDNRRKVTFSSKPISKEELTEEEYAHHSDALKRDIFM